MRKKLLSLISLLIAIVMCFTFVGCNDDDTPAAPATSAEMAAIGRVLNGTQKILDTAALKVELGGSFTESRTYANMPSEYQSRSYGTELRVNAEKRNEWVKIGGTHTELQNGERDDPDIIEYYVNLDTGYGYYPYHEYDYVSGDYITDAGKYAYKNVLPAGYRGYMDIYSDYAVGNMNNVRREGLEWLSEFVTSDSRSVTISFDLKQNVNLFLTALTKYYNNGGSVGAFLNEYLAPRYQVSGSQTPVGALLDEIISDIDKNKTKTFGDYIGILEADLGITLEEIMASSGATVDAEMLSKIKSRKVGDALTALLDIYESGEMANISPETLIDALFNKRVSGTVNLKSRLTSSIKPLVVTLLNGISVREVAEQLRLTDIARKSVQFNALDGNVRFEFDASGIITGATVDFDIRFTKDIYYYTSDTTMRTGRVTEGFVGEFTLSVGDITNSAGESFKSVVESKISDRAFENNVEVIAITGENTRVYFEKGKQNITVDASAARAYYTTDYDYSPMEINVSGKIGYDRTSSVFTIDKSVLTRALSAGTQSLRVSIPVSGVSVLDSYGDEIAYINLYLEIMPSDYKQFILDSIKNSGGLTL